jgi:tripartite-type tricarboxylate transporter receptor subunit TctC
MKPLIFVTVLLLMVNGISIDIPTLQAQPYPNRPIQLVIPSTGGSLLAITGRLLGDEIGKILGTQLIAVDKPGAGFTLDTDFVAKSKKDAYTLVYLTQAEAVYARVLNPKIEKAIKNPELEAKIEKMQFVVSYGSPAELKKLAAEEYERALAIASKAGLHKKWNKIDSRYPRAGPWIRDGF